MPKIVNNSKHHRSIDGSELVKRMDELRISQTELADRVGCSQGYISQIARPGEWEVKVEFADKIREVLE